MSKYLVTGGAGFIGSNIVCALVERGEDVTVLDNFSTGKLGNLEGVLQKIRLVEADICNKHRASEIMRGIDYVLHQAALPSVTRSVANPLVSNKVQVYGTLNMLWAACQAGVKRFVYAGSSSVYGDSEALPKREDMTPAPKSPYAVGKLAGEHYCKVFNDIYGLETVVLRYFNVFGPHQDPASRYSAVIPLFINAALEDKEVTIYGDGLQSRDFTYVSNVVDANLKAVESDGAAGQTMNIAYGGRTTLLEMLDAISEITGRKIPARHQDPRPGDVKHSHADITRAREILAYQPSVDLKEGLKKTAEFFSKRRDR